MGREITVVNENNKISSLSFMKRQQSEKWKPEETDKFFMALQIFGTDFSLIENIFEGKRTREQIKNKFRKEEKKNKAHIDVILSNKAGKTLKDFEEKYGSLNLGQIDEEALNDPNLYNFDSSSDEDEEDESESGTNSNEKDL